MSQEKTSSRPSPLQALRRVLAGGLRRQRSPQVDESVFVFSLHKCATSLFSGYVLQQIAGLEHIDYAGQIYGGQTPQITFAPHGHVYGVIRVSLLPGNPVYEQLVRQVATPEFVRNRVALFLVRDPRDVLVSQYYSFGFVHGYSKNEDFRREQEERRVEIRSKSIDAYAIEAAPQLQTWFATLRMLVENCPRATVVTYEDLVDDFARFTAAFGRVLPLSEAVSQELFARSRPRDVEDITRHKRSGKVGDYRTKLAPATIAAVNEVLAPTLGYFGYSREARG